MLEMQNNDVGKVTMSVWISKQHANNKIRFYSSSLLGLCGRMNEYKDKQTNITKLILSSRISTET